MKELSQVEKELYDRSLRRTSNENLQTPPPQIDYPDAKKHQIVSFIKSGIRILGYILIPFDLLWAAFVLALSEVVGIYEELV
tara:strand:+ start:743 stop:988 length:246 start_codon:yes stop_codon:yes gene_type:complete